MYRARAFKSSAGFALWLVSGYLIGQGMFGISAVAESTTCSCVFADQSWKGFGTREACTAVMTDGKKTCNVAFGARGADNTLIATVVRDNGAYQKRAYSTTIDYLTYVRDNNIDQLTKPAYIAETLPMFMRAAYLRGGITGDIKGLDGAVQTFCKEQADHISKVFRKDAEPYSGKQGDLIYSVSQTGVQLIYRDIVIRTVFMPIEAQK